jgi:uroporphyrin-3 C-methyltransferase
MNEPDTPPPQSTPAGPLQRSWRDWARRPWALVLLILFVIVLWQWYESHTRMTSLREELALRLKDSDADSRDARLVARQAQEGVREVQTRLAQLDAKLTESQNQQVALEALYQELARNRDESALAEVDQILTIASQQLQLAGNVQGALIALQTADQRLARSDRPQFIPLRKVLARDLDRLKSTPSLDIAGIAVKIDQVIALIDSLPLAGEERMSTASRDAAQAGNDSLWRRVGAEVWNELKSLIRIQVSDAPEPGLLAPGQAFFLRENLKLRLLNARLGLLSRDESTFREDIKTASAWLDRWFDARSKATQAAQVSLRQLSSTAVQIQTPSIADSLNAVRNYKVTRDRQR